MPGIPDSPAGILIGQGAAVQMMALGLLVLAAHLGGKLFNRLRLSEVTGQLIGGALVGPYALHLAGVLPGASGGLYDDALHAFHFFIFVFLSVVAFGIGEELHVTRIRKVGRAALVICLIQAALTWFAISAAFFLLAGFDMVDALLIGSIGIATAPAVTFVLMNQLRIEGRLRHVLGSMVVLDDLIEVVIFSLLLQISLRRLHPEAGTGLSALFPVAREVALAALVGFAIYLVLRLLVRRRAIILETESDHRPRDEGFLQRILAEHPSPSAEIFLVVMGVVALGAGWVYYQHWPFLITATFAGFLVANFHSHAIFDSLKIDHITPVLNLGFFALIGSGIDLSSLGGGLAWMAGMYVLTRMTGKIAGTWIGCRIMGEERKITACLPSLMLPQAGVAAVEAVYAGAVLGRPEFAAIILPAIVFFEVVGVFLVDRGLRRWRSWVTGEEEEMRRLSPRVGLAESARRLLDLLPEEFVRLDLGGETKQDVIKELVHHARSVSDQHIDLAQALQVLGERERLNTTGMGHGIAIPHCRLMGLDRPVLVFGRRSPGVDFGAPDYLPCDLFLLVLTCARDPAAHLQILSIAAHILGNAHVREELRAAPQPRDFIAVLRDLADQTERAGFPEP
ncbi:MAG TPA: cation:proton antiporter [bacterium]|nr:cation:proton antiporter [bacterium]HPQ65218.1 cation:proton antiporter [bacterium]